jgi:hypothetical protein
MQGYPLFRIQGNGPNEKAVTVEFRAQFDFGGLEGMSSGEAITHMLMTAMLEAGATTVSAAVESLQTSQIPAT